MENVNVKPPRTILEVYHSLPEGTLAQLINNQIIMSPAPTDNHQEISGEIFSQLLQFVKRNNLGKVRIAPYDVYLNRRNAYQPDIIFIASENQHKIKESGFYGAPDLVIEILSPSSWHYDKGEKKEEYERSGVKEYWMIDPADKSAEGFSLVNNEFQLIDVTKGTIPFRLIGLTIEF
jgi:Uma2 family endonuclease